MRVGRAAGADGTPTDRRPEPGAGAADPSRTLRDHAYHCFPRQRSLLGRAIRTKRYRLVEWKRFGADTSTAEYELYDYQADPLETKNIASEQPDIVARLAAILAAHPAAKRPKR